MAMRLTGMASGLDTDAMVKELLNVQRIKNKRVTDQKTKLEWTQDKWKDLNSKLNKFYSNEVSKLKQQSSYLTKTVSVSNPNAATVTGNVNATVGTHTLKVETLATSQYVTGGKLGDTVTASTKLSDIDATANGTIVFTNNKNTSENFTLVITSETKISDVVNKAKEAGLNAFFDETNKRLFISSKESGTANGFTITGTGSALSNVGLSTSNPAADNDMIVTAAQDSKVYYNGAEVIGSSNKVVVNGLTINLRDTTPNGAINLSVEQDTKAVYDTVKNFINKYNEILEEMNKLYNADSSRGYEPLSDDDRSAMSDKDIELYEGKIKNSLLRKDSTLGSLINSFRGITSQGFEYDGKDYYLSTFGITTSSNYMEGGLLYIQGDADSGIYSANENKLMKAIEENPEALIAALTQELPRDPDNKNTYNGNLVTKKQEGIATNLYKDMFSRMRSIPDVRSSLTFYNDKLMSEQMKRYTEEASKLDVRLLALEERYYKQFSAMEAAMSKLQAQSSSLSGFFSS